MSRGLAGLPRSFWFLVLGMWINRLGAFVLPFLSLYLQEREGLSEDGASIVLGAWGAGSVLAALVGGQLSGRDQHRGMAQPAADLGARQIRQHQVQEDQVRATT